MTRRYLIAAATGATGGAAARLLLEAGENVRALAHRDDARASALRDLGADVSIGDLKDFDFVRTAMQGVERAYFCYPINPGIVQATAQFAQAAKEAGVNLVVNMSQISARSDSASEAARQHWLAERVLDWSGAPAIHLRPTFFADWLRYLAPMIRQGAFRAPFDPAARHAPIASEDQGQVIAALLRDPGGYIGKTLPLFGPVELTHPEMADIISDAIGRPVVYQQVPMAAFAHAVASAPAPDQNTAAAMYRDTQSQGGRPDFLAQHLGAVALDHAHGLFAGKNSHVRDICGREAMSVAEYVSRHLDLFVG